MELSPLQRFSITYTPEQHWIGTDKFTYTVVKPTGEAGYGEVTVVVIENDPPVAMEDKILTRIGQEVVLAHSEWLRSWKWRFLHNRNQSTQ